MVSCTDNDNNMDWTEEKVIEISPEIVPMYVFGEPNEINGMRVKIKGENQWHVYPINFIEGFEFEPGYFYTLKVEITHLANPPQDWYNIEYKLIGVISKTKAEE